MSWPKVRLGDVCEVVSTRGHQIKSSDISPAGRYPVVSQSEVEVDGYSDWVSPVDDIPVVLFGDHTCVVKLIDYPFVVGADGTKLLKSSSFVAAYLFRAVQFESYFIEDGEYRRHYGDLADRFVPCPPLSEQRKIAASVDKAMKRVDAIERQFEKLRETAAACFKSVLKATFDEVGKAAKMIRLVDVCQRIVDCPHTTAKDEGAGFPLVRTPNVGFGRLIYEKMHRVSKPVFDVRNARAVPCVGDLIFAREAPAGNVAVIQDGEHVCLGQRTVLLQPNNSMVRSDYLALAILSPESQRRLKGKAFGATVEHVNVKDLRELEVGVPTLKQQLDVERRIYAAKARCDGIAALASRGLANCARMRKAILAEAFAV